MRVTQHWTDWTLWRYSLILPYSWRNCKQRLKIHSPLLWKNQWISGQESGLLLHRYSLKLWFFPFKHSKQGKLVNRYDPRSYWTWTWFHFSFSSPYSFCLLFLEIFPDLIEEGKAHCIVGLIASGLIAELFTFTEEERKEKEKDERNRHPFSFKHSNQGK